MTTTRKLVNFSFYVNTPTEATIVPEVYNINNSLDYIASILSLTRLNGENYIDFRNRCWDVNVHPSDVSYAGIVNGISRDLGKLRHKAMTISLKLNSAGEPIASNPRVDILANKVILYSDWRPNGTSIIDREIRLYKQDDTGYYLDDLIIAINQSDYFSATIHSGTRSNLKSTNLVRGKSHFIIRNDLVRAANLTQLPFSNIIQNSMHFEETNIFTTEVFTTPSAKGEYYIDYVNGIIKPYSLPSGKGFVDYHFNLFPYIVDATPIEVYTLQDDNYFGELFNKDMLDSGEEINALPNTEGIDVIHSLYKEVNTFWGE